MNQLTGDRTVGVIGLGLMGSSIVTSLVISGHRVVALAPIAADLEQAPGYLRRHLERAQSLDITDRSVDYYMDRITLTETYQDLKKCALVLECVIEDRHIKAAVYDKIESQVAENTIIGTNTSAIPISSLQQYLKYPRRFMGIHWAEPAYATRFLEITCGAETDTELARKVSVWAENWNKEPTLLQKDIRGFITNRLMYAIYREALSIQENDGVSLRDLDKAARYDMGSWIPLMGIFQRLDYMGTQTEMKTIRALMSKLSNRTSLPETMEDIVRDEYRGIHNGKGHFNYSPKECEKWKEAFSRFNRDMYFLSEKYAEFKPSKTEEIKS